MPIDPDQQPMQQHSMPGYSWTQGAASLVDPAVSLMKTLFQQPPQQTGFEGNIASPANPYDNGVYGVQSSPMAMQQPPMPQPRPTPSFGAGALPMQSTPWEDPSGQGSMVRALMG